MGKVEIHGVVASPPTRAIMIVCELAGIPYELKHLNPMEKTSEFKKMNPAQQIPVLVDHGFTLPESRAIMLYLLEKYAKDDSLYPKDLKARAVVNARLNFDSGTIWPRLVAAVMPTFKGAKITDEALQSLKDAVAVVEEFLTRDKWVAGPKMTVADISIGVFTTALINQYKLGFDLSSYPKVSSWLKEMEKLAVFKKINEDGFTAFRKLLAEWQKTQGQNA